MNTCPTYIKDLIYTHSFKGFSSYIKHHIISSYSEYCDIINCYIFNPPMNLKSHSYNIILINTNSLLYILICFNLSS